MRQSTRFISPLILLALASSAYSAPLAQTRSKENAPDHLQQIFAEQDDTVSRRSFPGVHLLRRSIEPGRGLAADLADRAGSAEHPVLVIASFASFPTAAQWRHWSARGVSHASYLGNRHASCFTTEAELSSTTVAAGA